MKRLLHRYQTLTILSITLLIGLAVAAAPFGGAKPELPDELLGLARMREVSLAFNPLPKAVRDAGVTEQKFQDTIRKTLTEAGFKIAKDGKTPRLSFLVLQLADKREEDTVGFVVFVEVVQKIRILRLDAEFTVPTTTLYAHRLSTRGRLAADVTEQLDQMLSKFIKWEKRATAIGR